MNKFEFKTASPEQDFWTESGRATARKQHKASVSATVDDLRLNIAKAEVEERKEDASILRQELAAKGFDIDPNEDDTTFIEHVAHKTFCRAMGDNLATKRDAWRLGLERGRRCCMCDHPAEDHLGFASAGHGEGTCNRCNCPGFEYWREPCVCGHERCHHINGTREGCGMGSCSCQSFETMQNPKAQFSKKKLKNEVSEDEYDRKNAEFNADLVKFYYDAAGATVPDNYATSSDYEFISRLLKQVGKTQFTQLVCNSGGTTRDAQNLLGALQYGADRFDSKADSKVIKKLSEFEPE